MRGDPCETTRNEEGTPDLGNELDSGLTTRSEPADEQQMTYDTRHRLARHGMTDRALHKLVDP